MEGEEEEVSEVEDLRAQVGRLQVANARMCAEVNKAADKADSYRRLNDELADGSRRLIGNVMALEELVRDMLPWVDESGISNDEFHEIERRIEALGIEVGR